MNNMKFYYSGLSARGAYPEAIMTDAQIMLTFFTSYAPILEKKPVEEKTETFPLESRYRRVHEARLNRKKAKKK